MIVTFLFIAALGVLLALIVLMGLFLGASGSDLVEMQNLLLLGLAPTLWVVFVAIRDLQREAGADGVFARIWQRLPGWLVFAFCLIFSLIFLAELAVFLVQYLSGLSPTWDYYIPIICGTVYALAFCVIFTKLPQPSTH